MGSAVVEPSGSFEAGSYQQFTLTYTAGYFGIDDTGSLKIVHRFASDMGRPQFNDPAAPNYVSVEASNGAVLHAEYDQKRNIRPWDKTLYIKVVRGFLPEAFDLPALTYVDNPDYADTSELLSLKCALDANDDDVADVFVSFGDVIFRRYVVDTLAETDADIVIAKGKK